MFVTLAPDATLPNVCIYTQSGKSPVMSEKQRDLVLCKSERDALEIIIQARVHRRAAEAIKNGAERL